LSSSPSPRTPSAPLSSLLRPPPTSPLFPYTTLFRSLHGTTLNPSAFRWGVADSETTTGAQVSRLEYSNGHSPAYFQFDHYLHKRSEEHTSELQSLAYLVCRLLLEKKKIYHTQLVEQL